MDRFERIAAKFMGRRHGVVPESFVIAIPCVAIQTLTRGVTEVVLDCHGFVSQLRRRGGSRLEHIAG